MCVHVCAYAVVCVWGGGGWLGVVGVPLCACAPLSNRCAREQVCGCVHAHAQCCGMVMCQSVDPCPPLCGCVGVLWMQGCAVSMWVCSGCGFLPMATSCLRVVPCRFHMCLCGNAAGCVHACVYSMSAPACMSLWMLVDGMSVTPCACLCGSAAVCVCAYGPTATPCAQ